MKYKLAICEWAFPFPGPAGFELLKELGIEGIELDFGEYKQGYSLNFKEVQKEYVKASEKHGIEMLSIAANVLERQGGMVHPADTEAGKLNREIVMGCIDAAAQMGIKAVQLNTFGNNMINTEEDYQITCDNLRFALDYSEKYDLHIFHENIMTVEETHRLMKDIGSDRMSIMYDTQNYYLNKGYNQAEIFRGISEYVNQLHIKDGKGTDLSGALLGEGDVGFEATAKAINDQFKGQWLILENYYGVRPLCNEGDPFDLLRKDIELCEKFFG